MIVDRPWRFAKFQLEQRLNAAREVRTYRTYRSHTFLDVEELLEAHFSTWAEPNHINRPGFEAALRRAAGAPQFIVETGTSAWGTDSTRLWDAYVRSFGGEVWSVDLSSKPRARLATQVCERTHLEVDDSVRFLAHLAEIRPFTQVGLCYLDSWDLDWEDPEPAENHGLNEWRAIKPLIGRGSILLIDDSPSSLEWVPTELQARGRELLSRRGYLAGKGALVDQELANDPSCEKIWHGYNSVYVFHGAPAD